MRYLVTKSVVEVIGSIWQPGVGVCAQRIEMDSYDIGNATDDDGQVTRGSLQGWLDCNAGDFQDITDFRASLEIDGDTVTIDWEDEQSELAYNDATYGDDF
jgi:hypothetical protein